MKDHDIDEVSDGAWLFIYFVLDCAVAVLEVAWSLVAICLEIGCWALAGGFDILLSMLGMGDE